MVKIRICCVCWPCRHNNALLSRPNVDWLVLEQGLLASQEAATREFSLLIHLLETLLRTLG